MNIVVLDFARLAGEPDFPPVDLNKFGWLQYLETPAAELGERCWRSDVVVTIATPIDAQALEGMIKLRLVVVADDRDDLVDLAAAQARGIQVCKVPGARPADASNAQRVCNAVIDTINAFIGGTAPHRLA